MGYLPWGARQPAFGARYVCMLGWGVRRRSPATLSGVNRPGIITRPKRQQCNCRSRRRLRCVRPIDIKGEYLVVEVEGGARRLETGHREGLGKVGCRPRARLIGNGLGDEAAVTSSPSW